MAGGRPVGYIVNKGTSKELNSGQLKTNPVRSRAEGLNLRPLVYQLRICLGATKFHCWVIQVFLKQMNKGRKFLKKLKCCVSRRVYQGNLVLSTELIT